MSDSSFRHETPGHPGIPGIPGIPGVPWYPDFTHPGVPGHPGYPAYPGFSGYFGHPGYPGYFPFLPGSSPFYSPTYGLYPRPPFFYPFPRPFPYSFHFPYYPPLVYHPHIHHSYAAPIASHHNASFPSFYEYTKMEEDPGPPGITPPGHPVHPGTPVALRPPGLPGNTITP